MEYKDDPDPGLRELTVQAGRHTPLKSVRTVNKCLKGGGGKKVPQRWPKKKKSVLSVPSPSLKLGTIQIPLLSLPMAWGGSGSHYVDDDHKQRRSWI